MRRLSSMVAAVMLITSMLGGVPAARAGGGETFYLALGTRNVMTPVAKMRFARMMAFVRRPNRMS